jgi:cytochrome c peroxidase
MKKQFTIILVAVFFIGFFSCKKETALKTLTPHLPATPYTYQGCGSFFGCNDNTPADNQMTNDGATLGRLLFYDPRMSLNNTVSCATCHQQANGFADVVNKSVGFESKVTRRNSMSIINEGSKSSFFWDGRATTLEQMVLMPVQNHLEMGMEKLGPMETKIASISYYPELFRKAFGTSEVTHERIAKALAQFLRSIRSENSNFDRNNLTQLESEGATVFMTSRCANCHQGPDMGGAPLFGGYEGNIPTVANSANIGLDVVYEDKGIQELTGNSALHGAFIIPSLRNLTFTAPYMHDGRYNTIEQVIDHYSEGIQPSPALDHNLVDSTTSVPVKIAFTPHQKVALAAFLRSMSDPSITTDVRFSNPFK